MAMSFKCSVFGHAYGDSEVEREREEDGSEVVTTIREKQTCKRCGETRVVSENKEVTTLETAADIVAGELDNEETADETETETQETATPTADSAAADTASADDETDASPTGGVEEESPPVDEDTVEETIPDAETDTDSTPSESAVETDPATDDGVILEEEQSDEVDHDREPGEWPDEPEDSGDEWRPETEVDPTPDEDRSIEPTGSAVTVPEGEFHCPECEFTTPVEESSLRQGDFCPECHRGSLEHVSE